MSTEMDNIGITYANQCRKHTCMRCWNAFFHYAVCSWEWRAKLRWKFSAKILLLGTHSGSHVTAFYEGFTFTLLHASMPVMWLNLHGQVTKWCHVTTLRVINYSWPTMWPHCGWENRTQHFTWLHWESLDLTTVCRMNLHGGSCDWALMVMWPKMRWKPTPYPTLSYYTYLFGITPHVLTVKGTWLLTIACLFVYRLFFYM